MLNSEKLMKEYDLEIDDVRWYLSVQLAEDLLSLYEEPRKLIHRIWDKSLEDELYNMEERYLEGLDEAMEQGSTDEVKIRQIFTEMKAAKRRRKGR
ncbi:hypothetical protein [Salinispira pacifica]|uniref:Uncharacterized protein n=1 Tax=Salinispira pacifica TaxID=1307761 RepID=V5WHL9_9SPIO|nr:hypothetical protein [Salinispira pacifica]AHC14666.1 hypothetical protein L21SP2_1265 [Salinispira pacifica]